MRLRARHQHFGVTVGETTYAIELDQDEDGWFVGDVEPDVVAKCVGLGTGEYQAVEESVGDSSQQDSAPDEQASEDTPSDENKPAVRVPPRKRA